jgi:hypothetical protein
MLFYLQHVFVQTSGNVIFVADRFCSSKRRSLSNIKTLKARWSIAEIIKSLKHVVLKDYDSYGIPAWILHLKFIKIKLEILMLNYQPIASSFSFTFMHGSVKYCR